MFVHKAMGGSCNAEVVTAPEIKDGDLGESVANHVQGIIVQKVRPS